MQRHLRGECHGREPEQLEQGQHLTVLLAEDDPDLRAMLSAALRRDGHHVVELCDGADLFDDLTRLFVDQPQQSEHVLVVADLRMPVMDSLAVLRTFKMKGHRPPFILMTAFGDPGTHASALELGALAVFDKPFDVDDLRKAVKSLARSPLLAEYCQPQR
jgi:two-component system, response regulator, stage 0 sporulation protein F